MARKSETDRTESGAGEAGRRGSDARSDLFVSVVRKESGGLKLRVQSKVMAFYGTDIRDMSERVARAFNVEHAEIEIDDRGALPFVIQARLEAALRRAGFHGDAKPECSVTSAGPTEKACLRRSRLYLPGNEPKFMVNAGLHRPDAVILDLEDSVHPGQKDAARLVVRNALRCVDFMGAERMVRINQFPLGLDDLDVVVPESPDLILIPKVEGADDVLRVHEHIAEIQNRPGTSSRIWLMPILESALGIEFAFEIASAADSVVALTIGLEDYTADLGVRKTKEGDESAFARARLVNAAKAAGIQAIDSVYSDVADMDGLLSWARRSRAMGFDGMGCIHPRQIAPIHTGFDPSEAELEKALRIVAAFEEATAKGLGVVSLGSKMIDPPVVLRAQRLVEAARRASQTTKLDRGIRQSACI